jgi:hypothetical protein
VITEVNVEGREMLVQSETTSPQGTPRAPINLPESTTPGLPPMVELRAIITDYFTNLNSIIPIFDENTFLQRLNDNVPPCSLVIAAVNGILALTYRHRATNKPYISSFDPDTCISNAESALSVLLADQEDLLSLQVLLVLVMLYLGNPYRGLSKASSLMGSAVKLVHKHRLHQSRTNTLFDTETSLQRARVFWVAYILDRDISLRTRDPPLLREEDHDLTIPSSTHGNGLVRFTVESGAIVNVDLLQAWIQLAHIQGDIYEGLYSMKAEMQPLEVQQGTKQQLHERLREWLETIPVVLHPDRLAAVSPKPAMRQLVVIYFAYISSCLQMEKIGSHRAEWIAQLVDYSQQVVRRTEASAVSDPIRRPLLESSSSWEKALNAARDCIRIFRVVEPEDSALTR